MKEAAVKGYLSEDTIAAEASPPGRGGISVIRVSGPQAKSIGTRLFQPQMPAPGRFKFGCLYRLGERKEFIDEAIALFFKAPYSYTGEDVVEFNLHGSPVVVEMALEELYRAGARPAAPGEFTCRAFLNGRIDLTQAEAVADLIASVSQQAARQATRQLAGSLRCNADRASAVVSELLSILEIELDFTDSDLEDQPLDTKLSLLGEAEKLTADILRGYHAARNLRTGLDVAILGAPNVGKSSLLNALIGAERAIVHPEPGTTRDIVEAKTVIAGVEFRFKDTAGLRAGAGEVEDEGIRRAMDAARQADIIILMRSKDHPQPINYLDIKTDNIINVLNKSDLKKKTARLPGEMTISVKTKWNLMRLAGRLGSYARGLESAALGAGNRERHFQSASAAREALYEARRGFISGIGSEIIAESLRTALAELDSITGKNRLDGLLEQVFSQFCVGK